MPDELEAIGYSEYQISEIVLELTRYFDWEFTRLKWWIDDEVRRSSRVTTSNLKYYLDEFEARMEQGKADIGFNLSDIESIIKQQSLEANNSILANFFPLFSDLRNAIGQTTLQIQDMGGLVISNIAHSLDTAKEAVIDNIIGVTEKVEGKIAEASTGLLDVLKGLIGLIPRQVGEYFLEFLFPGISKERGE